jgi:hypothetical protein
MVRKAAFNADLCHVRSHVDGGIEMAKVPITTDFQKRSVKRRRLPACLPERSTTEGMSNADEEKKAVTLENESVHRVYDIIASHFSDTRYKVCHFLAKTDDSHGHWWKNF